jgi:hypothetical protein
MGKANYNLSGCKEIIPAALMVPKPRAQSTPGTRT